MSSPRFSLDTNILIYAMDQEAGDLRVRAAELIDSMVEMDCILTTQALGEFYFAVTRKGKMPGEDAEQQVLDWMEMFPVVAAPPIILPAAMRLVRDAGLSFWDAMLVATVGAHGVTRLWSEDMQDGRTYEGVTVADPFKSLATN